jgi:hypothetical protein
MCHQGEKIENLCAKVIQMTMFPNRLLPPTIYVSISKRAQGHNFIHAISRYS